MFQAISKYITRGKNKGPEFQKISLGVCAMDKKATSKPMREILKRLPLDLFDVTIFGDDCILNWPIEEWPVTECLIAFFSKNYPLEKVLEYIALRKPYLINDLEMYAVLCNRRKIYEMLEAQGIDVPVHIFVERTENEEEDTNIIEEYDDYVMINGSRLNKPFVEKPYDAEDHNIYIYYPMSTGGGSKRLFRKVNDRSSEFYPMVHEVRRSGSFIYEEFLVTQGTDVKVYTVGPDYGHAEARKSPVVDGRVNRDSFGLEVRYPVILSYAEKEISRMIVSVFKQTVCGFDILRVHGKSYVCDVNGFSFVKNSRKYYDDASQLLAEHMIGVHRPYFSSLAAKYPVKRQSISGRSPSPATSQQSSASPTPGEKSPSSSYAKEELECVVAVMRHGDRTPKQKLKVKVNLQQYLDFFHEHCKDPSKDIKVKNKTALLRFLAVTVDIVSDPAMDRNSHLYRVLRQVLEVLERFEISGINRKLQMKPQKVCTIVDEVTGEAHTSATELLLIMKWGGDLTPLGRHQAELLGRDFRKYMYPDQDGGGVLRLHATYRHDLKIKASDEGRVMKTAAAFTKGLLELEGQLTPILASLVTVQERCCMMLDKGGDKEIKADLNDHKHHMNMLQMMDSPMTDEMVDKIAPECTDSVKAAMFRIGNPRQALHRMYFLMGQLCAQLQVLYDKYENDEIIVSDSQSSFLTGSEAASTSSTGVGMLPGPPTPDRKDKDNMIHIVRHLSDGSIRSVSTCSTRPLIKATGNLEYFDNKSVASDDDMSEADKPELYLFETYALRRDRWNKIYKDFFDEKKGNYDLTKVPDTYDMIRYDVVHNSHVPLEGMNELYKLAMDFADCVVSLEFGVDREEKRNIGASVCGALLEKIKSDLSASQMRSEQDRGFLLDTTHAEDLAINSLGRCVRTRLYFTSESHMHAMLNVLKYSKKGEPCAFSKEGSELLENTPELSYLTQIVFRLFRQRDDPKSCRCEIYFSPGANYDVNGSLSNGSTPVASVMLPLSVLDSSKEATATTTGSIQSTTSTTATLPSVRENEYVSLAPYVKLNNSISYETLAECLENGLKTQRERAAHRSKSMGRSPSEGSDLGEGTSAPPLPLVVPIPPGAHPGVAEGEGEGSPAPVRSQSHSLLAVTCSLEDATDVWETQFAASSSTQSRKSVKSSFSPAEQEHKD